MTTNGPFGGKVDDWTPGGYLEVVTLKNSWVANVTRNRGENAWFVSFAKGWGDACVTPLTPSKKAKLAGAQEVHELLQQANALLV